MKEINTTEDQKTAVPAGQSEPPCSVAGLRSYLSFGGGVNSVALHLLCLDWGLEFEGIFVDQGADWPETYEYFEMFQGWLKDNGHKKITVLTPDVQSYTKLYDYYFAKKKVPSIMKRDCTDKFKLRPVYKYVEKPCFMLLGIDAGESHRARLNSKKGVENRFPLIEENIDRDGCKKVIRDHSLPVPMKSGCFSCMFQRNAQWKELRKRHPDLFCKAQELERACMDDRISQGKKAFTLRNNGKTIGSIINEKQQHLWDDMNYPPCQCGL